MRISPVVALLPLIVLPAVAADAPGAATTSEVRMLDCQGPFATDASEASLKQAFGAENVEYKTVPGAEGVETQATVIYPNDPARMVTVFWWDEAARTKPATIQVQADYAADPDGSNYWKTDVLWQSTQGVKIGSSAAEVEALNGKPFKMSGFGWDYGGFAVGWEGGKLDTPEGSACSLSVRFSSSVETPPDGAMGDTELMSNSPEMLGAKPRVTEFSIGYPMEDTPSR
ncbi:MAG: hypothetical protein IT548_03405 [Alphaproteobacteria bacterium]|nr:hypothetical protein [Alphaproteobacteria bacterium]